eukprot:symbB.v1.2.030850.t2/scaffold3518.1/size54960/1
MRCTTCMDSSAMLLSVARLEVTIFVLGAGAVGLSILVRSFTRLELSLLILNFAQLDLALFARHLVRVDGDLTVGGALRFSETTYLDSSSGNLEAYVSSTRTLSLSSEGGTLHGLWSADTVVSLSDRRLKRNIRPLQKALPKAGRPEVGEKLSNPKISLAMSDGSRELEENENSLALATDCAKLWPKMLSKGLQDEYPPQGQGDMELSEADLHTIKVDVMRTRGNHPAFGR